MTELQKAKLKIKSLTEENTELKKELANLKRELPTDHSTRKKYFEGLIHKKNNLSESA